MDAKPTSLHPDDLAVDRLAAAMKAKLAAQRAKGYGGWNDLVACPPGTLQPLLLQAAAKGDALDVANFAMMLFCRNESSALSAGIDSNEWERELLDWVSACQSAYHIESTPGHRFGGIVGQLEENREGLLEYVRGLLSNQLCKG